TADRRPSTTWAPVSNSRGYTPTTSATVPPEIPGTSSASPISAPRTTLTTASSGPGRAGAGDRGSRSESATGSWCTDSADPFGSEEDASAGDSADIPPLFPTSRPGHQPTLAGAPSL